MGGNPTRRRCAAARHRPSRFCAKQPGQQVGVMHKEQPTTFQPTENRPIPWAVSRPSSCSSTPLSLAPASPATLAAPHGRLLICGRVAAAKEAHVLRGCRQREVLWGGG